MNDHDLYSTFDSLSGFWAQLTFETTFRACLLMALAGLVTVILHRRTAAVRRLVWILTLAGVLLLPALSFGMPAWRVLPSWVSTSWLESEVKATLPIMSEPDESFLPAPAEIDQPQMPLAEEDDHSFSMNDFVPLVSPNSSSQTSVSMSNSEKTVDSDLSIIADSPSSPSSLASSLPMQAWLLLGWLSGMLSVLAWSLTGWLSLRKLGFQARVIDASHARACLDEGCETLGICRAVKLLESDARTMPMTWGVIRPTILLPASAGDWSPKRMRAVLLHELAHVKQRDVLWLMMVRLAQALHWFNPLVWIAGRKLRDECERSCDDTVLRQGTLPPDYAEHVLRVAVDYPETARGADAAVALARMSSLERRLRAILDPSVCRSALRGHLVVLLGVVGLCVLLPLSTLQATAPTAPQDKLIVTDIESGSEIVAQGDSKGANENPVSEEDKFLVQVKSEKSGEKLRNVRLRIDYGLDNEEEVELGESNEYRMSLPSQFVPMLRITVIADGHVPIRKIWKGEGERFELPEEYTFTLPVGTSIGGLAVNENDEPIAGASIHLFVLEEAKPEGSYLFNILAISDANGRWYCDQMPQEYERFSINQGHPDYITYRWLTINSYSADTDPSLDEFKARTAKVVFRKGLKVQGQVIDSQGLPVEGATIAYGERRFGDIRVLPVTETDEDGRFRFYTDSESLTLCVFADSWAIHSQKVDVKDDLEPIEIKLDPGRTVRWRVEDEAGNPLPGALAGIKPSQELPVPRWRSMVDDMGRGSWVSAPETPIKFSFYKKGYMASVDQLLMFGDQEHVIVMHPTLVVSGTVTDIETGKNLDAFRVTLGSISPNSEKVFWGVQSAKSFQNGEYRLERTHPRENGTAFLFEADGYNPFQSRTFMDDEGHQQFDVALSKGPSIRGVVRRPDGSPVVGATVVLNERDLNIDDGKLPFFGERTKIETDAHGAFELPPTLELPLIAVIHEDGYGQLRPESFDDPLDIVLDPWAVVEGTYQIGSELAREKELRFDMYQGQYDPEKPPQIRFTGRVTTDNAGRFRFEHVPAGEGWIMALVRTSRNSTSYSHRTYFQVKAGGLAEIQVGGKGRPVIGHLSKVDVLDDRLDINNYNARARLIQRSTMPKNWNEFTEEQKQEWGIWWTTSKEALEIQRLQRATPNSYAFHVQQDGSFRIEDVLPGKYRISIDFQTEAEFYDPRSGVAARVAGEFLVEAIPEGRMDEPLNIGEFEIGFVSLLKVHDPAPVLEVQTLNGEELKLSDFLGKFVLLNFWTSESELSIEEISYLKKMYDKYGEYNRFVMIGLSLDKKLETPQAFVAKHDLKWMQAFLGESEMDKVTKAFGVKAIPNIMLIDPEGNMRAMNLRGKDISVTVDMALRADRND